MKQLPTVLFCLAALLAVSLAGCSVQQSVQPVIERILPQSNAAAQEEPPSKPFLGENLQKGSQFSAEEPLRFTFPTPAPLPVSVWRPPLYDTPWALNPNDHFYFTRPIAADEVNWPLANYRYGDFFPDTDIVHTGIDIDAARGTPVIAAGAGKVIWSGLGLYRGKDNPDDPYGLAVVIKHDFGYKGRILYTVYAHMDEIFVQYGDYVKAGDPLGVVGNTGFTTGPHLHFEVRLETNSFFVTRNPELWLAPPQGWGVLVGRLLKSDGSPLQRIDVQVRSKETGQIWEVRTYGPLSVNSDDYYKENMVLSDLPSGAYVISFTYQETRYQTEAAIQAGAISYINFRQGRGFNANLPSSQEDTSFIPSSTSP